ncbi:hypothetical protein EJD97_007268 [Solanum chilense]|uniref:Uncharacterized protein n=1 Tax=Solanum chilense TaxID=4083 RepID=A0A6N2CBM3_SOLCI|nr:hypothetical protein EJD97_007268 [Solanum chilense]
MSRCLSQPRLYRPEEDIVNAGVPPCGDQVSPFEEDMYDEKSPVNPPLTDDVIRASLFQMAQAITTQTQTATTQAQAMNTQANREVVPLAYQQIAIMDSRLRDFTRINPPTFYRYKFEEDP